MSAHPSPSSLLERCQTPHEESVKCELWLGYMKFSEIAGGFPSRRLKQNCVDITFSVSRQAFLGAFPHGESRLKEKPAWLSKNPSGVNLDHSWNAPGWGCWFEKNRNIFAYVVIVGIEKERICLCVKTLLSTYYAQMWFALGNGRWAKKGCSLWWIKELCR